MVRVTFILLAGFLFQLLGPSQAHACTCSSPGPACQAAWRADAVFVGRVVNVAPVKSADSSEPRFEEARVDEVRVSLRATEVFRGAVPGLVEVFTGADEGVCGYRFSVGGTYLIYASQSDTGTLGTSICTGTKTYASAGEELDYLRGMSRTPTGLGVIRGTVVRADRSDIRAARRPHADARVIVEGAGIRRETVTRVDGSYEVPVPAGKYDVSVDLPDGMYYLAPSSGAVTVPDVRACALANFIVAGDDRAILPGR